MAVSERVSLVTIISWILGGGLIWSLTSLIYNDVIKQPYLDVLVGYNESRKAVTIDITNTGMATANNIRTTINSTQPNIDNERVSVASSHEQVRLSTDSSLSGVIANASRFVPQDQFSISIPLTYINGQTKFDVTATYNERMQQLKAVNITSVSEEPQKQSGVEVRNAVILPYVVGILAVTFVIIRLSLYFKPITEDVITRKYCSEVKRQIKTVHETLRNEQTRSNCNEIFPTDSWDSKTTKEKQKIFHNYQHFNKINEFYKQLRIRDYYFSNNPIDNDRSRIENESCYQKACEILDNNRIPWTEYDLNTRAILRLIKRLFITMFTE